MEPEEIANIPLYCINLRSSTGRRERMTRRFAALGLLDRVRFVEAVEADSGEVDQYLRGIDAEKAAGKKRSGVAATMSHFRTIRTFLDETTSDVGSAIVFEDDILLHRDWHERLASTLGNLPPQARVCALGYLSFDITPRTDWLGRDPSGRNLVPMVLGDAWGSFGYWISREFAHTVLDEFDEITSRSNMVAEHVTWRADGLLAQPPLVIEEGIDSTLFRDADELGLRAPHYRAWGLENYIVEDADSGVFGRDPRRPRQTICLCMIVRNESKVIGRLAASVRDLIDAWVVCDTGSTDGTPELVGEAFEGIEGELFVDEWEDFGANRTRLLERARGRADYLLLLDADQTLVVRGRLGRLEADAYSLVMDEATVHWLPRLVRGDLPWRYVGATHEYLACEHPVHIEQCPLLIVEHHGDGSNRSAKSDRDLVLLEKDLAKDPENPRTVFYLAQTYREMGEDQLAIDFYVRRISLGGWDEEMFYSMYWRAELVARRDWDLGVVLLMEAFEYRPSRAEPLYSLARGFRSRNQYQLAAMFAERAMTVPFPNDVLFVHRDLYNWGVEFEWSICAFHLGDYDGALAANDRLLAKGLPDAVRTRVEENREVCQIALGRGDVDDATRQLTVALSLTPLLTEIVPGSEIGEVQLDVDPPWPQFNPSIASDGTGFKLLVRTSNYRMDELGRYSIFDDDGVIRSLYYEVELGPDLSFQAVRPIVDTTTPEAPAPRLVMEGIEDCRLVEVAGRWFALAASRQYDPSGLCRMALASLDDAKFKDPRVLVGPDAARNEKNWVPFVVDDQLFVLYSCSPTVIYRMEPATGALSEVSRADAHFDLADERGGSQGLAVDGGTLFVTHRVAWPGDRRLYQHRFVLLDDRFRLVAATPRFSFRRASVEFCAGMARAGDDLVLSFGTDDAQAFLARVPYEAVRASMWPL